MIVAPRSLTAPVGLVTANAAERPAAEYFNAGSRRTPLRIDEGDFAIRGNDQLSVTSPSPHDRQACRAAWYGHLVNRDELLREAADELSPSCSDAELVRWLYGQRGAAGLARLNGRFAFALYYPDRGQLVLGRDQLGQQTLYYHHQGNRIAWSTSLAALVESIEMPRLLNLPAVRRYLAFNYNPAEDTFYQGVYKVPPGCLVVWNAHQLDKQPYWTLDYRPSSEPLESIASRTRELCRTAVHRRIPNSSFGVLLSGGLDSSSVAAFLRERQSGFASFSYRCQAKTFDESPYARHMAERCDTQHHELIYRPDDIRQMESIVAAMDEPFCNVGIVIATWLLGQAAEGRVSHLFSGDGGDELFGGHPVYTADKMAQWFERIPWLLRQPLVQMLRRLPDGEKKLSLAIKAKRFSESLAYPRELGTHRWRVYYQDEQLDHLLTVEQNRGSRASLFAEILRRNAAADGPDALSRSLAVDFHTELGFSLRRLDLLQHFGIAPVVPLLDLPLVEFSATIPSEYKIRGFSDMKYIQRIALEGVLPQQILHRKDKLGHSIPLKNWLRHEPGVREFVGDLISPQRLKARGMLDAAYVQRMWTEHQDYRHNHSHRLWALATLELWLLEHGF